MTPNQRRYKGQKWLFALTLTYIQRDAIRPCWQKGGNCLEVVIQLSQTQRFYDDPWISFEPEETQRCNNCVSEMDGQERSKWQEAKVSIIWG